jgi:hypothetical protein
LERYVGRAAPSDAQQPVQVLQADTRIIELTSTALVVAVPNTRTKEWLETGKVAETVQTAFGSSGGFGLKLEFVVEE